MGRPSKVNSAQAAERPGSEGALAVLGLDQVVVRLLDVGAGEVGLGGLGVVGDFEPEDCVGGKIGARSADGFAPLPGAASLAFEPGLLEADFRSGVGGVDADVELFAGRDAAGSFVGSVAAEAAVFDLAGVGGERGQVEAEEILECDLN